MVWAPQVLDDAKAHGLVLGENGQLYDTKLGQSLPEGISPMQPLSDAELGAFPELSNAEVVRALFGVTGI